MVKVEFDLTGVKIPKRVAGVKVPKALRKRGKKLLAKAQDLSASPQAREAIATGLTIVAATIAAKARAKAEQHTQQWAGPEADGGPVVPEPPVPPAADGRAPGTAGIDPATDPAEQLNKVITAGIGALQGFLLGAKKPS